MSKKAKKPTKVEFNLVLEALKKKYPDAHCALHYETPFQLLIATILSAQCTDERVNIVTKKLFAKYPDAPAMNLCPIEELQQLIHSAGFYKNKSKNIKECCVQIIQKYQGRVPETMEELYELPGVGRKTANVVLGNAFNIASGVVVDTHVMRLSNRFGWVKSEDAVKIEEKLNKLCLQGDWVMLSHYLISHGRSICKARNPDCENCFLNKACPKLGL